MKPGEIRRIYEKTDQFTELDKWLSEQPDRKNKPDRPSGTKEKVLHMTGLSGSSPALVAASVLANSSDSHVFVLPDKETAAYFQNDLNNFLKNGSSLFFPSSYKRSVQYYQKSKDQIIRRTEVLKKLTRIQVRIQL